MKAKVALATVLVPLFAVLAVYAGLAWINNVCIVTQWDPQSPNKVYHGPMRYFDVYAVDFSTATTFIPFFGFGLIAAGLIRILMNASSRNPTPTASKYFPFFLWYNPIMINLGLIGTVWGLIMIGFYPDNIGMKDLIHCLNTALYSTLVALVWVYTLVIPLRRVMQWLYKGDAAIADPQASDLESGFRKLGNATAQAGGNIGEMAKSASSANAEINNMTTAMKGAEGRMSGMFAKQNEVLDRLSAAAQAHQSLLDEHKRWMQNAAEELEAERAQRQKAEQDRNDERQCREKVEKDAQAAAKERDDERARRLKADQDRDVANAALDKTRDQLRKVKKLVTE